MNINYNPEKAHGIFDMTESEDGPSPSRNQKKYIVKNVRKMEKDDINNIIGLRKSTKLGNLSKSRTNQYTGKGKSSVGAQSSIHEKYKIGNIEELLNDDEI